MLDDGRHETGYLVSEAHGDDSENAATNLLDGDGSRARDGRDGADGNRAAARRRRSRLHRPHRRSASFASRARMWRRIATILPEPTLAIWSKSADASTGTSIAERSTSAPMIAQ